MLNILNLFDFKRKITSSDLKFLEALTFPILGAARKERFISTHTGLQEDEYGSGLVIRKAGSEFIQVTQSIENHTVVFIYKVLKNGYLVKYAIVSYSLCDGTLSHLTMLTDKQRTVKIEVFCKYGNKRERRLVVKKPNKTCSYKLPKLIGAKIRLEITV